MVTEDSFETKNMNGNRAAALVPKVVGGVKRVDEKLVAMVQERPVATLCGALAVGYLVGRIFSSRG